VFYEDILHKYSQITNNCQLYFETQRDRSRKILVRIIFLPKKIVLPCFWIFESLIAKIL